MMVTVTEDQQNKIAELMEKEDRNQAYVVTRIFNDGMKLLDQPESNLSYQQRIANDLVKKKDNG